MLKRRMVLALGFAALAVPWGATPGLAAPHPNALNPTVQAKEDGGKKLRFFADRAAKKWPLRGSLKLGVGCL